MERLLTSSFERCSATILADSESKLLVLSFTEVMVLALRLNSDISSAACEAGKTFFAPKIRIGVGVKGQ